MKKLLLIILMCFFSYISFSQERELSNYEKYRLEKDKLDHPIISEQQDTIFITDTVYIETEELVTNNYYIDGYSDYYPTFRFGFGFGFYYPYYTAWYYNSWYNPWYYPYYSYYPYPYSYYYYYPYYGSSYTTVGRTSGRSSMMGRNFGNAYRQIPGNSFRSTESGRISKAPVARKSTRYTSTNRAIPNRTAQKSNRPVVHRKVTVNRKSTATRTQNYRPTYKRPTTATRPQYNNSRGSAKRSYSSSPRNSSSRSSTYKSSSSQSRGSTMRSSSSSSRSSSSRSSGGRKK